MKRHRLLIVVASLFLIVVLVLLVNCWIKELDEFEKTGDKLALAFLPLGFVLMEGPLIVSSIMVFMCVITVCQRTTKWPGALFIIISCSIEIFYIVYKCITYLTCFAFDIERQAIQIYVGWIVLAVVVPLMIIGWVLTKRRSRD